MKNFRIIIIFVPLLAILGLYALVKAIINNELGNNNIGLSPIAIMVQHDNIEPSNNLDNLHDNLSPSFNNWEVVIKNNYINNSLANNQEFKINHLLLENYQNQDINNYQQDFTDNLAEIPHISQHIYELVKSLHWRKAQAENKKLQVIIKDLEIQFPHKKLYLKKLTSKIDLLHQAIVNKDKQMAMRNSNQITFIVADINKKFPGKIPVEIYLLNYYQRELEISIPTGNKPWLRKIVQNIHRTWLYARPVVLARGHAKEVHKFDMLMVTLNNASLSNDYSQIITLLQKEQANLERIFL